MLKNILYIILISCFSLTIISCAKKSSDDSSSSSSTTEAYEREALPSETTVTLPTTLTGGSTSSRTAYAPLNDSFGVLQVQNAVSMMKSILLNVEFNMIIMDAAISQSKVSIGNCYEAGTLEVTFTAEMVQALKDVYSKLNYEMTSSELSTYSAMVDTQISNDDFPVSYATTSTSGFEKILTIGVDGATCSSTAVSSILEVMMWTDNGNKLQYTFDFGDSNNAQFGTVAYDRVTKTSSFDLYYKTSSFDGVYSGTFTECTSSANDCVTFRITMGDASFKIETRGKADNNGGYGLSRLVSSSYDFWVKELWDTTLKSLMYAYPCTNATWDNVWACPFNYDLLLSTYGETSNNSSLTSYETDAGKIFSQTWKATPGKTSAFLADSVGQKYAIMTTAGSTNVYDIAGIGVKLDNTTVGFNLYFEPTRGDVLSMQDLSVSASNKRSISSTAVDNLSFTYAITTELEGTWVVSCYSWGDLYWKETFTVSGSDMEYKTQGYTDSSCSTAFNTWYYTYSSVSIGDTATFGDGATGHWFTFNTNIFKYTLHTSELVTYNNTNSYCGYSDWELNTTKDVTGKTCGSTDYVPINTTGKSLYKLVGNNLNLATFNIDSYPTEVGDDDFVKQ